MKVLLVGINSKFIHSNLAVRYLEAYTRDLDFNCKIREFSINDRVERVLEEIMSEKPDLVAFSCYIWNLQYVESLANLIKLVNPDIEILYGGPEVSFESDKFLGNSVGDYVIAGEGENTFKEFIIKKLSNKSVKEIKGLYSKTDNKIVFGGLRENMNMEDLIFPYKKEDNLENKIVYYEASRGCPFMCKYCLSSTIQGVRNLNIERVKQDLKFFIDKKVRLVKFVDRTFNCDSKYAMEIWEYLISQDTTTAFHFEISANLIKDEEIELLAKAPRGRFQLEVGVQTTDDTILKNISRNIKFKDIEERVLKIKKLGNIKQHLDLIAGLPGEDFATFKKSFNDVHKIEPEEIQLGFLKLLKGSSMRSEAEIWGMAYSPYAPYEILKTKDISYEELVLLKRVEEMVDKYYNSQKFTTILKYFISKFATPFDFYFELGMFFHSKGYFDRSISSADYYKVFIEFSEEVLKEKSEHLKEIVKYDYLCFNKKKWLPEFLNRYNEKEMERKIKDLIKSGNISVHGDNYHVEVFKLDIFDFIKNNTISNQEKYYLLFDEDGVVFDVTDKIII